MADTREISIRKNFDFFQSVVGGLMPEHAGKYALLRDCSVIDIFPRPMEALETGHARFADGSFSIQKVTDRPFDLGFMSYGAGNRTTD